MSYNTRRQSGQGMGIGRGGSQVLYHQPRSGPQTRVQQQQSSGGPTTPQHGYSTQQPVNPGYATQPSAQSYTTQQTQQQQQQQQQQQSTPPASQGYTSQQYQSQPQQQQQQQPSPQTPQPASQQQQQQPPPPQTQTPQQPPPVVKSEPVTPKTTSMEVDADTASGESGAESGKVKSWQLKKKMPGFKINKKVKKRRQNARLRKILQPKNAIMVLNELKAGIKFSFQEHTNALTQTMFVVNAEVDGKVHTGQGLSKPLAKQNAAENALKALLLEKMAQAAIKVENTDISEPMQEDTSTSPGTGTTNNGPVVPPTNNSVSPTTEPMNATEGDDTASETSKPEAPEDEVPWGSLASFALYKLFTDWQSQGTHVPIPKQTIAAPNKQIQTAPAPMKKVPDNPTDRHPVMLLNQMRPGIQFTEISREGTPPNLTFTLGVTVDGKPYTGVAKNKKDAKKEAAKAALAGALNIFYD